ncbi:MAG TPA: glycosyltransferase [Ktedonobacteraceae bacterium]|nr:glycosyltransferase [Ktedonobacteraceae bacterium]
MNNETPPGMVKKAETQHSKEAVRVCMHVRGVVRTDGRVLREARALIEAGFSVTILDIEKDLTCPAEEEIDGIQVKHIVKPAWFMHSSSRPRKFVRSIGKIVYSALQLIKMPADIYHAHDMTALPASYLAACVRRKPLVFDAHEWPLNELRGTKKRWLLALSTRLLSIILHRCAGIITVSSPIAQEICRRFHVAHVSLVRNILAYQTPLKSNRLHHCSGISPEKRIVLYQGNLQEDRGLDTLVRAAAFLDEDNMIVLMGKAIGATQAQLEALIADEGVADRVKILPPASYASLLEWTASADMGVIINSPDHSFNVRMSLPNKLFEYLMAGLPVLASPLDAVAQLIRSYDVGHVLLSLTPAEVGATINSLLVDRAALSRWSDNARDAVRRDLCWEKESQHLIHLYQSILTRQNEEISDRHYAKTV